jgi:UTP--glucose-1-phosphate uridylyltransferase
MACIIQGKRYDTGDRLGYLQATIEFALKREDLRESFQSYILSLAQMLKIQNDIE